MRYLILFLFGILCKESAANMASPMQRGTVTSISFINKNVNILNEEIYIRPTANFETAYFTIRYTIEALESGKNIPLLFHAIRYDTNFVVLLDGIRIPLLKLPDNYFENSAYQGFSQYFDSSFTWHTKIKIPWNAHTTEILTIQDLQYFALDISKGQHVISVSYRAKTWVDRSQWIKSYSMPYALTPARFWKSFGKLSITIDNTDFQKNYTTNFGLPASGNTKTTATWFFDQIPQDIISLNYTPEITKNAARFISFGPANMAYLFLGLFAFLHGVLIYMNRKNNKSKKASAIFWIGTFIVPLLTVIFFMYSYTLIDNQIGIHASKRHGYTFIAMIFYPVLVIGYGIILYIVDYFFKKK